MIIYLFFLFYSCILCFSEIIYEGEIFILTSHQTLNFSPVWLNTNKTIKPLSISSPNINLKTGDIVRVKTSLMPDSDNGYENMPIYAESIDVILQPQTITNHRQITEISSITFLLNICGGKTYSKKFINKLWFNNTFNLHDYYKECSFSEMSFDSKNNIIVGPIDIPCQGNTIYGNFDSTRCDFPSIRGWIAYAEQYTVNTLKIDIMKYKNRIAILSDVSCTWMGLGTVGCGSYCYTWIRSKYMSLPIVFHEIGHNFGLFHSSADGFEYGDDSCAMSIQSFPICFNSAHNDLLNWTLPYKTISQRTPKQTITLPASSVSRQNFIKISRETIFFYVTYKVRTKYDRIVNKYHHQIIIHQSYNDKYLPEHSNTYRVFTSSKYEHVYSTNYIYLKLVYKNTTHAIIELEVY